MLIRHRLLLLSALLFLAVSPALRAQPAVSYERGKTQLEDILPASPEPASRVKYASVPFTQSLGSVVCSVPLWELKGRQLTIPISLEYCSNGIKMDEIAGVAGLGWTLNAGGCVTRDVVYMPDEFTDGGFSYTWPSSSLLDDLQNHVDDNATMAFLRNVLWNRIDTNSDRYSYDVCGLKGSFIISPSHSVIQLQGPGVKIVPTWNSANKISCFTITGPDGTVYTFSCLETGTRQEQGVINSTIFSGQQADWDATTAWLLTSITSRDGTETATFIYEDAGTWNRDTGSITRTVSATEDLYNGYSESLSVSYSPVKSEHSCKVLRYINLSGFQATFDYASESSHSGHTVQSGYDAWNYPKRLTAVSVSFDGASTPLMRAATATARHLYDGRILLNGINIYRGGVLDDRWTFTYNTLNQTVARTSQDWYGYYNGETDRLDLCPYQFLNYATYAAYLTHGAPSATGATYMLLAAADHDGARTAWECERAMSGDSLQVGGAYAKVSIGTRVRRMKVYDGNTLVQERSYTYDAPRASGPYLPLIEAYLTTSAKKVLVSGQNPFPADAISWAFSLHETPVSDGENIQGALIWYGTVTEDVSGGSPAPGYRTVYTFNTASAIKTEYNTLARFPSEWADEYSSAGTGVAPFDGVPKSYSFDGAKDSPLLTAQDFYKREAGSGQLSQVQRSTTSHSLEGAGQVMCGYKAVQVMEHLFAGMLYEEDIQHYPLYKQTSLGYATSGEVTYEYFPSGTDTSRVSYSHVDRSSFEKPSRVSQVNMLSSDAKRSVKYFYPDTWTGEDAPAWRTVLTGQHALSEPLKRDYITYNTKLKRDIPGALPFIIRAAPVFLDFTALSDTTSVVTEYSYFGGHLMPSATVEYRGGVESWRDEVLARNSLGNPTRLKSKGEPEAAVTWDSYGLYPQSLVRGNNPDSLLVSTFTFIPGVGIQSMTDPDGVTTSWTYTPGGRLASARNTLGQTTDSYSYSLLNDGSNRLHATHYTYRTPAASSSDASVQTQWWNTLGMRILDVNSKASGDALYDLVTGYVGDYMLNDDVRVWLPYPVQAASADTFRSGAPAASAAYHGVADAYSGTGYEQSARGMKETSSLPGYSSHRDSLKRDVFAGFPMLIWQGDSVTVTGTYGSGQLTAEWSVDADRRKTFSLKDHVGRQLASSRAWETDPSQMTRYIYDKGDRLCAVAGAGIALTDTLAMWRYAYDSLGRLCSKAQPGAQREHYTYDCEDRITEIRRADGLEEISYDAFNRVLGKWWTPAGGTRVQTEAHTYVRGREVQRSLRAVGGLGQLQSSFTYDTLGRVVRTVDQYPDGHVNDTRITYDFSGSPVLTTVKGTRPGLPAVTDSLSMAVTYDCWERLTRVETILYSSGVKVAGDTTVISYDALGRRVTDQAGAVKKTLSYALQGWQKSIAWTTAPDTLYAEILRYEDVPANALLAVPSYTGKIAQKEERRTVGGGTPVSLSYCEQYAYDCAGQLSAWDDGIAAGESFTYDRRGNILSVTGRHAQTPPVETYSYTADRLASYTPSAGSTVTFTHDVLGRMTGDGLAGLTIAYNRLDQPETISSGGTIKARFEYLPDGTKISATDNTGAGLLYRGPFIYRVGFAGFSRTLESVLFEGGRLTPAGALYHITDHLGSVRAVVSRSGDILAMDAYGVYGALQQSPLLGSTTLTAAPTGTSLRYHYTGQEDLSFDFTLPYTDFGARQLSPGLRRWLVQDKKSEKYYDLSPYAYCAGDPVNLVDPDGNIVETAWDVLNVGLDAVSLCVDIKEGKVGAAILDGVGLVIDVAAVIIPLVPGGAGAIIKASRSADKVADAAKTVERAEDVKGTIEGVIHGNSKLSTKAQHAYDIIEKDSGKVAKTGISGESVKNGKSSRAESQVRKWNKEVGYDKYESIITYELPAGEGSREKILQYEQQRAYELKKRGELDPKRHKRP